MDPGKTGGTSFWNGRRTKKLVLDLSQASLHNQIIHLYQIIYNVPLIKHTNLCLCVCCLQNVKYVWKKSEFDSVNPSHTDFLMGK